jgi:drug/metabolite transporter (DMT)-like permease
MSIGILIALASVVGYTFNTLFLALLREKGGVNATKYILSIALILNAVIHLIVYRTLPFSIQSLQVLYLSLSAIAGYVFGYLSMIHAMRILGPQLVLLIMTSQTVLSFVLGWIVLGERHDPICFVYVALIISGIILAILNKRLTLAPDLPLARGLLLAFALPVLQAFSVLLSKKVLLESVPVLSVNVIRLFFAVLGLWIYTGLFRQAINVRVGDFRGRDWRNITLTALIGPVVGIFLSFTALKLISLGIASSVMQLSPVFMIFLERIVFKTRIRPVAILGTGLAVTGTVLLILY